MISVVVPLYNKETSIHATLESVRTQSYTDWECIVVDDGSTDNSLEVAEQFKIEDLRFKIFTQTNNGVSAARNRGVKESSGKYVAFLDADDLWASDYLETLARLIADYPNASLYGLGYAWLSKNNKKISNISKLNYRGVINLKRANLTMYWTSSSSSSSREMLIKSGLFNTHLTHGEDLDMWWRLLLTGEAVFDSHECAYYVQDAENRAMAKMPPIENHVVSIIDQYNEARLSNPEFRKAFDTQMIYFLYDYLFTPYKKEAQRLAEKLDYSQLKKSFRFRMKYPYLYCMYVKIKELIS